MSRKWGSNLDTQFIPVAKPIIGVDERKAVDRVLSSGLIAQGPEVAAFEREFSSHFVNDRTTVAVNSGTSGLHLGLLAAGVGEGDEVIVPSFTFAATANSVALTGATPVFADIEADFFTLNPESVKNAITQRTKGIMPVHLYGHPFQVSSLQQIASEHGLMLFEDAAQAHGASWKGDPVGSFGTFAVFSLYPTKNMTSGEGGMVSCENYEIARKVKLLRNQGMEVQYANELIGYNARMTDIHASIGRVQLTKVDAWTEKRRLNAELFNDAFSRIPGITIPTAAPEARHVYHQYTLRVPGNERFKIQEALKDEHGIGTGVYYPIPNHRLPSLSKFAPKNPLTETERAASEVLSLPVHPTLSATEIERIVNGVLAVCNAGS